MLSLLLGLAFGMIFLVASVVAITALAVRKYKKRKRR